MSIKGGWRRVSFYVSVSATIAAILSCTVWGQGLEHPFWDRTDSGETVHILPPPASIRSPWSTSPTFTSPQNETAVYAPSYGSGNLIDHGGLEIATAGFWAIYWNSAVANSTATSLGYATISAQINAFVSAYPDNQNWDNSNTDDFTIIQQYGSTASVSHSLGNYGFFVDSQASSSKISDSQIRSYLTSLFNSGKISPSSHIIYGVYFPAGMRITLQGGGSCTSFCGYHGHFTYNAYQIKYAVFPYPNCSGCSLSGLSVADMLTIVGSHEIREAVTDPGDNGVYAWYDSAGYEADDKCAWHNLYQMTNGSFWIQPEYSNGGAVTSSGFSAVYPGPGCVVPNK